MLWCFIFGMIIGFLVGVIASVHHYQNKESEEE